jgi:hypothetical protein
MPAFYNSAAAVGARCRKMRRIALKPRLGYLPAGAPQGCRFLDFLQRLAKLALSYFLAERSERPARQEKHAQNLGPR